MEAMYVSLAIVNIGLALWNGVMFIDARRRGDRFMLVATAATIALAVLTCAAALYLTLRP